MASETRTPPKRHGARYDWLGWFNAGRVELVRGRDYWSQTAGMVTTARVAAKRMGKRISVSVTDDQKKITITVLED